MFFEKKKEEITKEVSSFTPSLTISLLELDALKETANIGSGSASIALSNIFNRKVSISLPTLEMLNPNDISKVISGPDNLVVGIYSKIQDGMQGNILTLIPMESALQIARTFIKDKKPEELNLNDKDKLLLQKIGTAIYVSYLSSLAKFFEKKITFATPSIVLTHGNSIHEFLSLHLGINDKLLLIKLDFDVEDSTIAGNFYLLLTAESIAPLLINIKERLMG